MKGSRSHQHTVVGVVCSYIALWPRLSASWCQSVFVSLRREVRQARHAPRSAMCLALEEMPSTAGERIWAGVSGVAGQTKKHWRCFAHVQPESSAPWPQLDSRIGSGKKQLRDFLDPTCESLHNA